MAQTLLESKLVCSHSLLLSSPKYVFLQVFYVSLISLLNFKLQQRFQLLLMKNLYNNRAHPDICWECCYLVLALKEEITEENAQYCPATTKWSGLGVPA